MSTVREVLEYSVDAIKLGVIDSQVDSVRTQSETQTAVRVYENGLVGLASAVGAADLDALAVQARESHQFGIVYPLQPEGARCLAVEHEGDRRSIDELVSFAETVLRALRSEFPSFVFAHGVLQETEQWRMHNDRGLDLSYRRDTSTLGLLVKKRGSGNIMDTLVTAQGPKLDAAGVLETIRPHLIAYDVPTKAAPGPQRVVFAGLEGMARTLLQLLRSDLTAANYAQGASIFDGKVGDGRAWLSERFSLTECRDPARRRVCPFDVEGVVRDVPSLPIVDQGRFSSLAANKRDAARYGLPATGTAVGDVRQLPTSGFSTLAATPTAAELADLLDGEGGVLVALAAGGEVTRTGDVALPIQVLMTINADGEQVGRAAETTLTGNLFDIFGDDFVGVTEQTVDRFSDDTFLVARMNLL